MRVWQCALRGDGRESCPGSEGDRVEATLFPCLYETYPSDNNIIGGSLQVDEPVGVTFNKLSIAFGVIALVVWVVGIIRLRQEIRNGNSPLIAFLVYVFVVAVGSVVCGVLLQLQLNDSSDVVCRGYTSLFGEYVECAIGYVCNGNKLEKENDGSDVALMLFFCASAFLSPVFGAVALMVVIVTDVLQCDCFVFFPN